MTALHFRNLALLFIVLILLPASGRGSTPPQTAAWPTLEIREAELHSIAGRRSVDLPHVLDAGDFEARGGRVRYRLSLYLPELPGKPLGILVRKMSLSGEIHLNGQFVGACEHGLLEEIRCLHRPYLFVPPSSLWQQGINTLELEIFANDRQSNGLAPVMVGDSDLLHHENYMVRYWLQVSLVEGLTWLAVLLGTLSLAIGYILRQDSVYLWFGLTSLVYALGNINWVVTRPAIDMEFFSWLVFCGRLVSVPLLLITMLAVFGKRVRWFRLTMLTYACVAPLLIWLTGNDRSWVIALYVPLLFAGLAVLITMLRWTVKAGKRVQWAFSVLLWLVFTLGLIDWMRLSGKTAFEGLYLVAYGYGFMLLLMGGLLLSFLASSLATARELGVHLEARVQERTMELEKAHQRLLEIEKERTRSEERERLLQDMHDGLGSQLASARLMAERGQIGQPHLAQILRECMADLYLLVDTLGNSNDIMANALSDFRFRTQRRLSGTGIRLHWNMEIEALSEQPQRVVLQILRIAQEALNNALKHAQAGNIWFEMQHVQADKLLRLRIADDGIGMDEFPLQGRGIGNMRQRAQDIGARLSINKLDGGTELVLNLPLADG